jgi:hypothetical protein
LAGEPGRNQSGGLRSEGGREFYLTPDGMIAWNGFQRTDVRRNDPSAPLTRFFNPALYGIPRVPQPPTSRRTRDVDMELERPKTEPEWPDRRRDDRAGALRSYDRNKEKPESAVSAAGGSRSLDRCRAKLFWS